MTELIYVYKCLECGWQGKEEECQHSKETPNYRETWHVCPKCNSRRVSSECHNTLGEILGSLYLNYAKRALMGGGKGKFVIGQLRSQNPELADSIMDRARAELQEELDTK